MSIWIGVVAFLVVVALCVVPGRRFLQRLRRVQRLEGSEKEVAKAVADGRLSGVTGEALLQHLDGLRRKCSGDNGS